jgi:predicted transcriptional regulator
MNLEDAPCSKTRIKILKVLMRLGQFTTSQIAKKVGGNYDFVREHLEILERAGSWRWHSAVQGFSITGSISTRLRLSECKHYCKPGNSKSDSTIDRT